MSNYKAVMNPNFNWQTKYAQGIQDTGIVDPRNFEYTAFNPPGNQLVAEDVMTADNRLNSLGVAPVTNNPASMLYSVGNKNMILLNSQNNTCQTGCVKNNNSDPRLFQVKPLYQPEIFTAGSGLQLPTVNNVVGMY